MTQQQYNAIGQDADRVRSFLEHCARSAPEWFPAGFDPGSCLHGLGRESRKLSGLKRRTIVWAHGASDGLRPSFIFSSRTGTAEELADPWLWAAQGVPFGLLTLGCGHHDRFWYRLIERLGRHSRVGTTVHDPAQLPAPRAADEPHADGAGQKGDVATTVGEGGVWGVALTASAEDAHLAEASGVFAAEARDVEPEYAPETVNTDGWAATRNAFPTLFPRITVVLCVRHGFLTIRDRCRKACALHRRVWDVSRAATAEELRRLRNEFQQGCATPTWTASVHEMRTKLWNQTECDVVASSPPGCHRTSHAVDRPRNRLCRLRDANRGRHGHQGSSE